VTCELELRIAGYTDEEKKVVYTKADNITKAIERNNKLRGLSIDTEWTNDGKVFKILSVGKDNVVFQHENGFESKWLIADFLDRHDLQIKGDNDINWDSLKARCWDGKTTRVNIEGWEL
jgi:hypothetical protein